MPATYRIDHKHNLVVSWGEGPLSLSEILEHQQRLGSDPLFHSSMNQLLDFGAVTELHIAAAGVRRLAEANLFSATSCRAIVVDEREVFFGLARMYELLRDRAPEQIHVFRSYTEALAWLGLPLDYPRPVTPVFPH